MTHFFVCSRPVENDSAARLPGGPASRWFLCLLSLALFMLAVAKLSAQEGSTGTAQNGTLTIAGPQQANDEGRTELPMQVRGSIGFREIGPAISGGRITAVAGIAGVSDTYYVGAADGGVFRTTDGGMTWKALFQHEHVASVGALAVDPVNPGVVWAGTGEANLRNDVSVGDGIYKSTDSGAHWRHMGLAGTAHIDRIAIDPYHPDTVLVSATGEASVDNEERGVFRTTDGGATWAKVLYLGPGVGIADMAMDPKNPQIVFAAAYRFRRTPWSYSDGGPEDAIYKSEDEGRTWRRLSGHGLPLTPVGRIGLAVAESAPGVVYAVIGSKDGVLWRSDDEGEHWHLVSKDQEVDARPFYFSHIAVDPKNADHVIALSNDLMESKDGGANFSIIAKTLHGDHHAIWIDPAGSGRMIEGNDGGVILSRDNAAHWAFLHNIAVAQFYHVSTGKDLPYQVCGGLQDNSAWCGLGRSKDPSGILDRHWSDLNGGDGMYAIPAADNPDLVYNSTQNGVFMIFDRAAQQVHDIEPYPRDFAGGGVADLPYRFAWNAGFAVAPGDPKVLYAGANVVFKSEDRGHSWKPISPDLTLNDKSKQGPSGGPVIQDNSGAEVYDAILQVAPSAKNPDVIWVGTDDGQVQVTRDGGAHWSNVTEHVHGLPSWGRIESIDLSPDNPGEAYIAVNRHFSGDPKPYLYRTADFGASWQSLTGDLPAMYAHVLRRDTRNPHMFYAGLENGLYVTWDDGAHWYLFGLGLPNTAVYDLTFAHRENDLVVATHGRGIWVLDDLTPFQGFKPGEEAKADILFAPAPALRFWPWSQVEALGDAAFYGKNPLYGAGLSYFVAKELPQPGELVIKDAEGHTVRTMKGTHELPPGATPPDEEDLPPAASAAPRTTGTTEQHESKARQPASPSQNQQGEKPGKGPGAEDTANEAPKEVPWVPTKPGLQRIYWDLRGDGPVRWENTKEFNKGPISGALLPPGEYTATLTLGGQTTSQRFEVTNDPRSPADAAGMARRYKATEAVLHELSQLDVALNRLDAIEAQLGALRLVIKSTGDAQAVKTAIDAYEKRKVTAMAKITSDAKAAESTLRSPDQIREHLTALNGALEGADDAPTPALLDQARLLEPQYQAALGGVNDLLGTSAVALNKALAEHRLTGVVTGEQIQP